MNRASFWSQEYTVNVPMKRQKARCTYPSLYAMRFVIIKHVACWYLDPKPMLPCKAPLPQNVINTWQAPVQMNGCLCHMSVSISQCLARQRAW